MIATCMSTYITMHTIIVYYRQAYEMMLCVLSSVGNFCGVLPVEMCYAEVELDFVQAQMKLMHFSVASRKLALTYS